MVDTFPKSSSSWVNYPVRPDLSGTSSWYQLHIFPCAFLKPGSAFQFSYQFLNISREKQENALAQPALIWKKITRNYFDTGTGSLRIRIWSLLVKRPLGHFFLKLPSKVIALYLLEGWCYSLFDGLEKFCKCGQQNCWLWSSHVNHSLLSTKQMSVSLNILAIQTH